MSEAIRFLHALAQGLATSTLYAAGHQATRRSAENLWRSATQLLAVDPHPVFLFLGTAPVYAGRALHEMRDWQHSARLAAVGVQRLELDPALTLESAGQLIERLVGRLAQQPPAADEAPIPGAVFGVVAQAEGATESDAEPAAASAEEELLPQVDLEDELDAMQFIRAEAARGVVARGEADAVARILTAIVGPRQLPQVGASGGPVRYHVVHAVNTALLAMTAAAAIGVDATGRHRIGVVALLHDIGTALLPPGLADQESFPEVERIQFETHPALGGALLLRKGGPSLDLAAVVAYEHHLRPDGGGYPVRRFGLAPHWASRLVACCATVAAMRAARPFRAAWSTEHVVRHLGEGAGTAFDAEIAGLLAGMLRVA